MITVKQQNFRALKTHTLNDIIIIHAFTYTLPCIILNSQQIYLANAHIAKFYVNLRKRNGYKLADIVDKPRFLCRNYAGAAQLKLSM